MIRQKKWEIQGLCVGRQGEFEIKGDINCGFDFGYDRVSRDEIIGILKRKK